MAKKKKTATKARSEEEKSRKDPQRRTSKAQKPETAKKASTTKSAASIEKRERAKDGTFKTKGAPRSVAKSPYPSNTAKAIPLRVKPASSESGSHEKRQPLTHAEISERAYQLFVERGGTHGYHMRDWLEAKRTLQNELATGVSASYSSSDTPGREGDADNAIDEHQESTEERNKRLAILNATAGLWKERDDLPDTTDLRNDWNERLGRIYRDRS